MLDFKTAQPLKFLDILKTQDPAIQYTSESENKNKQLHFFDFIIKKNENNSYDFKFFRKTTITNV